VRALLEGQNARLAARRQDTETIKRIKSVLKKGNLAVSSGRFDELLGLNQEFHQELARAGQNGVLGDLLKRLRERTEMLFSPMAPSRQARSWQEHAGILEAIVAGDERAAAALAAEHVLRAGTDFLVELAGVEEDPPQIKSPAAMLKQNRAPEALAQGSRRRQPASAKR